MNEWVFEAGDRDFKERVLERSKTTPVVVDFWAPWCGPCRTLGPLIEPLASEHGGDFYLAKVNVDENPGLASAFRVQSIPLLIGFRDGRIVAEGLGAMPEHEVRAFLQRVLPTAADQQLAEANALISAGQIDEAEKIVRKVLEEDARSEAARLALAKVLMQRHEASAALELLEQISPGPLRQEADRLAASIRVGQSTADDEDALRARVAAAPDDFDARLRLGRALAAAANYEEALSQFLEVIRHDKNFRDGDARKAMLDIFELLGADAELVQRYRSELAKVLFS